MATAKAQPEVNNELYLKGRTIKAHIDSAKKHQEKYENHCKSAGILLAEAKAEVKHGEWIAWLDTHGINRKTAARLMGEAVHPERAAARQAQAREYKQEQKAKPNVASDETFAEPTPEPEPAPEPVRKAKAQPKAKVEEIQPARAVKLVRKLNSEQLMKVIAFIIELLGEDNG